MAFDECTPDQAERSYAIEAMKRTHRWAKRSLVEHQKNPFFHGYRQFLFGIVQGAGYKELREESARTISNMDFDGVAIGGESIGYNMEATKEILDWVYPLLPHDKPHYAMGVGFSPTDLFEVVERGIDMFDCVAPTRLARNGALYVHPQTLREVRIATATPSLTSYRINITNANFREDKGPVDPLCTCYTCEFYSRGYLHHLFKSEELLAYRLATIHNVHFFLNLMKQIREAINEDRFLELKSQWVQ